MEGEPERAVVLLSAIDSSLIRRSVGVAEVSQCSTLEARFMHCMCVCVCVCVCVCGFKSAGTEYTWSYCVSESNQFGAQ